MVASKAKAAVSTMATKSTTGQSMLWGSPIEFWDLWGVRLLFIGAVVGVGGLVLSALSAYVLYRVADVAQKDLAAETSRAATELGQAQADIEKSKAESAQANERIAELSTQAEQLRKDTAEANARAAAASLELERLKAPRTPSFEAFMPEIKKAQPSAVEILYVQECSDCRWLADNIWGYLKSANWPVSDPRPIEPPTDIPGWLTDKPSAMKAGASPWGVSILTKNRPIDLADNSAFNCLFRGLFKSLGSGVTPGGIGGGFEETMPEGLIRVIVAPRA